MADYSKLKSQKGKKHALVVTMSTHAHMAGILRHSMELAKRGVTVSFVAQEKGITLLKSFEELQDLDFNLISFQNSESEAQPLTFLAVARHLCQPILDKFLKDKNAGLPGPTCIMGDRFFTWLSDAAKDLNIPYYQFWSCGAIFVRLLSAYPQLLADGVLPAREIGGRKRIAKFDGVLNIPGLPALTYEEIANSNLGVNFLEAMGNAVRNADAVIVNTFYELEIPIINSIRQSLLDSGGKDLKLFPVGPLSVASTFKDWSFVEDLDNQRHDCLKWLDTRSTQSVVYVCLGSLVQCDSQQMNELAIAIEATELSFLWVIRGGSEGALPHGFVARMKEKGMIVSGWVPQLQILAHSSVGGFLTHCGWNSIIESVSSGVPMAAWPQLKNDQFLNCRYIVDVLKIATEVRPQDSSAEETTLVNLVASTNPVKREELEKAMRLLMSEEGNAMRLRVQDLKQKAEAAIADGGSSKQALDDLILCIPA